MHGMKPKILIVDDGESQRFVLKGFLLSEGYLVDEAENGIKALQCVRDQHFDIILLDHKMPGMNGVEVLKEVKRTNPEIVVVIISAYGTIERAVEAMDAGAFYYITKPVELDKLLILLDHISQRYSLINRQRHILHQRLADMNGGIDAVNDQKQNDTGKALSSILKNYWSIWPDNYFTTVKRQQLSAIVRMR
jgi:DNA-binding NtrC family response regulator